MDEIVVSASNAAFFENTADLEKEGAGFLRWRVFLQEDYLPLRQEALDGNDVARRIKFIWDELRTNISHAARGHRFRCALCTRSLKPRRFAFCVVLPYGVDEPERAMVFGLCERCAPGREKAEAAAQKAFDAVYPDTRSFIPHPTAGHA